MKKYITLILFTAILGSFTSCEDEAIYTPDERFVLQAYLYANEPVWDVTIKNAVPLSVADSVGEPINDAVITLYKNDVPYTLVSSSDTGTYHYPGDDLLIETGDVFSIEATISEETATGSTSVPDSPQGVFISTETIKLPEIDFIDGVRPDFETLMAFREAIESFELSVVWDNPNGELYFVVVESVSSNQISIFPTGGKFAKGRFRQVSKPTRESSYEIKIDELTYWGAYVAKVYRVNQEYSDLYENLEQDSRDLNEPPTNIKNGLGIFSAFNSQNVYFEVKKESTTTTGW